MSESINILLLSMSTLNRKLTESYYSDEKDKYFFCGVSQLEAGTKYFLRKLEEEEKVFQQIYVIESPETRKAQKENENEKTNATWLGEESGKSYSPVEFYKKRIKQYICGEERRYEGNEDQENAKMLKDLVDQYEKSKQDKLLQTLYPDPDSLFVDIEVAEGGDKDNLYKCVDKLCEEIRKVSGSEQQVKLYLDMQGARRYESFIINAAVKILASSGIRLEESVAIDFSSDNNRKGKMNKIVDTTVNDRIFEMVSGMNEFLKTGRGDTLLEFKEHSLGLLNLEEEDRIIEQIRMISDAISLCDIEQFDKELQKFSHIISEYKDTDNDKKNPYFKICVDELRKDYENRNLLKDDNTNDIDVISQIEWCMDKKLYQQALTLVEARIPKQLAEDKIWYCKDSDTLRKLLDSLILRKKKKEEIDKKNKDNRIHREPPMWKPKEDYYYEQDGENAGLIAEKWRETVFFKHIFYYEGRKKDKKIKKITVDKFVINTIGGSGKDKALEIKCDQEILELFDLYFDLKEERNKINHAVSESNDKREATDIEKRLTAFIKKYKHVRDNKIGIDISEQSPFKEFLEEN